MIRLISVTFNSVAIIPLFIVLAMMLSTYADAIKNMSREPEDVFLLSALVILVVLSIICSATNILTYVGRFRKRAVSSVLNWLIVAVTGSMFAASIVIASPDWILWAAWFLPYAAHLICYSRLVPNRPST